MAIHTTGILEVIFYFLFNEHLIYKHVWCTVHKIHKTQVQIQIWIWISFWSPYPLSRICKQSNLKGINTNTSLFYRIKCVLLDNVNVCITNLDTFSSEIFLIRSGHLPGRFRRPPLEKFSGKHLPTSVYLITFLFIFHSNFIVHIPVYFSFKRMP